MKNDRTLNILGGVLILMMVLLVCIAIHKVSGRMNRGSPLPNVKVKTWRASDDDMYVELEDGRFFRRYGKDRWVEQ